MVVFFIKKSLEPCCVLIINIHLGFCFYEIISGYFIISKYFLVFIFSISFKPLQCYRRHLSTFRKQTYKRTSLLNWLSWGVDMCRERGGTVRPQTEV